MSYEFHGEYKCVASNELGTDEKSIDIDLVPVMASLPSGSKLYNTKQDNWIKIQVLSNPKKDHIENGTIKLKCLSGKRFQEICT